MYDDTIVAIATATGEAGIGVVRLSGRESLSIGRRMFSPSSSNCSFESHRMYHGRVLAGARVVDEALFVYMRGPRSYTAEDIVEIQGHGGPTPLERILHLAIDHGARLANPGEFTLRAFLNGRIDLAQAEAVADVIHSRSEASLRLAVNQLGGRLSQAVDAVRRQLLGVMARLEAHIDFSEDDVPPVAVETVLLDLHAARQDMVNLLRASDEGILYRRGARVAIAGRPNAGKSSLMNSLLRMDRAIVTPIAGTTRDTIEETVSLQGLPVTLVDTAGIAETLDVIEQLGVERSHQALAEADLILFVYDASAGWTTADEEIAGRLPAKPRLTVANKVDLLDASSAERLGTPSGPEPAGLRVSAMTREGLGELEETVRLCLLRNAAASNPDDILVNNLRHKTLIEDALRRVDEAMESAKQQRPADFVCIDLRAALSTLGSITGTEVGESLLDEIFSRFCIGK